jgi:hypothetical protein
MCATFLPSDKNQFRVNFTTMSMSTQENMTHFLHSFNTDIPMPYLQGDEFDLDDFHFDLDYETACTKGLEE